MAVRSNDRAAAVPVGSAHALATNGRNEQQWWPCIVGFLIVVDAVLLLLAGTLAYDVRFSRGLIGDLVQYGGSPVYHPHFYAKVLALYVPLNLALYALMSAYRRRNVFHGTAEYQQILYATGLATLMTEFSSYLTDRHYQLARGWLLLAWLFGALFVMFGRFTCRRLWRESHRRGVLVQRAIVAGAGHEGQILEWHIHKAREEGMHVVGYVDAKEAVGQEVAGGLKVLGSIGDLPALIETHRVGHVIVATSDFTPSQALDIVQQVLPTRAELALAPDLFRTLTTAGHLRRIGGDALLVVDKVRITGIDALLKNALDICGALLLLVVSLPVAIAIGIAVKMTSPGPIFTRHPALGAGGKQFNALKFRTITWPPPTTTTEEYASRRLRGLPLRANPDCTGLGRFLSKFSLDELPQLLNVLARQMSLVGPYKISPDQLALYGGRHLALFTVKPGLTGACQIYGRGELTVEERSLLDAEYVRTYSIWRDLQILLATLPVIAHGRGAY